MISNVPVLLLIYNRPELTRRVFDRLREAAPKQLFIAADGPRSDRPNEVALCAETRSIVNEIDWPCEVHRLFREENLGCKSAVSNAITWFFEHVEEGIILEDDCVPHPTFFRFCNELLEYYRYDERIMVISGDNFQHGRRRTQYSYYFSRYNHIWGWATWRRAWQYYDGEMKYWPDLRNTSWLFDILGTQDAADYWYNIFDKAYAGEIDSWGYPWTFSCWVQNGLTILPEVNLVSNIGFGDTATHTKNSDSTAANIPTFPIQFPLRHPPYMVRHRDADQYTFDTHFRATQGSSPMAYNHLIYQLISRAPYAKNVKSFLRLITTTLMKRGA